MVSPAPGGGFHTGGARLTGGGCFLWVGTFAGTCILLSSMGGGNFVGGPFFIYIPIIISSGLSLIFFLSGVCVLPCPHRRHSCHSHSFPHFVALLFKWRVRNDPFSLPVIPDIAVWPGWLPIALLVFVGFVFCLFGGAHHIFAPNFFFPWTIFAVHNSFFLKIMVARLWSIFRSEHTNVSRRR